MSIPSHKEREAMTPMMRQYFELKEQCPGAILFFRMGDFYEIFGTDAEEVAPVLQLVLTSRERGDQQRIPFCGVPHHSAKGYWIKLLKRGYKIAMADQVEDPATAKGLVRREIIKILTPGCIDEIEGLDADAPNYLIGIYEEPTKHAWSLAMVDVSTGEFRMTEAPDFEGVLQIIQRYRPREILCRRFFISSLQQELQDRGEFADLHIDALPEAVLRDKDEQRLILEFAFQTKSLKDMPVGKIEGGEALAASILTHIKSLQISLGQFMTIRPLQEANAMTLDETVIRDLEIYETQRRRQIEGSLYGEINRTQSAMGARYLRHCLGHPMLDQTAILDRQNAVAELKKLDSEVYENLRKLLKVTDLERLITKLVNRSITPTELSAIRDALANADLLIDLLAVNVDYSAHLLEVIAENLRSYAEVYSYLEQALCQNPTQLGDGDKVFKQDFSPELAELNKLAHSGTEKLREYETSLRDETGISSLKIKNHKTFGLLIEVTKANLSKVPSSFIRRQTMVNCERFVTIELKELADKLISAQEQAVAKEFELYVDLVERVAGQREALRRVAFAIASLDLLQSFTYLAREEGYTRPEFSSDGSLHIKGARHPVVFRMVGEHKYTPTDLKIDKRAKHLLITGPNMAGKSTVMRQVALIAILHQMGAYIPASEATLPLFDRVFTRVGASDDLARGQSTFMVEMNEAAHILRQASPKSLVILDEVGRGTSTQDGLAIASAILEDLVNRVQCYSMFATHYHELVPFAKELGSVECIQPEVQCSGEDIVFTHKIIKGASGNSYGLEVAKYAGVPEHVIERARTVLKNLAPKSERLQQMALSAANAPKLPECPPLEQRFMVSEINENKLREISDRLLGIKIHRTTPLQALNLLNDLRQMAETKTQKGLFDS